MGDPSVKLVHNVGDLAKAQTATSFALSQIAMSINGLSASVKMVAQSNLLSADKIAQSNQLIAASITRLGFFTYNALTSISTEMKTRREMDEYYLLEDRIDSLHEKIIREGGDLLELYNEMRSRITVPIDLTEEDCTVIYNLIKTPQDLDWLIDQCSYYGKSPIEMVKKLFKDSDWTLDMKNRKFIFSPPSSLFDDDFPVFCIYYDEILDRFPKLPDNGRWTWKRHSIRCKKNGGSVYLDYKLSFNEQTALAFYESYKKHLFAWLACEGDTVPSADKRRVVSKLQIYVNARNYQIVLNNLRLLYEELRIAYLKQLQSKAQQK